MKTSTHVFIGSVYMLCRIPSTLVITLHQLNDTLITRHSSAAQHFSEIINALKYSSTMCLLVRTQTTTSSPSVRLNRWTRGRDSDGGRGRRSHIQSAAASTPRWFSGMSVDNDSLLECLHVPWRDSNLQAKPERYQMVVSEHQWRR